MDAGVWNALSYILIFGEISKREAGERGFIRETVRSIDIGEDFIISRVEGNREYGEKGGKDCISL